MNRLLQYSAVAIAVGMLGAASPAWPQAARKGDPVTGRKVYLADGCWQCHGRVGQGGLMTGPAPVLAQTKMPFAAFTRQVRNPVNDMPPYPQTLLPEKDLTDIYAFLQALPGRRPVKDMLMLNH